MKANHWLQAGVFSLGILTFFIFFFSFSSLGLTAWLPFPYNIPFITFLFGIGAFGGFNLAVILKPFSKYTFDPLFIFIAGLVSSITVPFLDGLEVILGMRFVGLMYILCTVLITVILGLIFNRVAGMRAR